MSQKPPKNSPRVDRKVLKDSQNLQHAIRQKHRQTPKFGICFDVDGVLARGTIAIPAGQRAARLITDEKGDLKVPCAFVTNALNRDEDKAAQISGWLNIPIAPNQMVQAQGPLKIFKEYHNKHCLVIGQGKIMEIVADLGFTDVCTIEDIADAYPLLDMVDHDNRRRIAREGYTEKTFRRVEAIVLMGEPKRWETPLQLVVDLLKTDGKPDHAPTTYPEEHLPVIACNMDLQFMDRASMPRYGHGAFLLCLEALYKKSTGSDLKYTALIGKPSETTFRYAEHCLSREAGKIGIKEPLERMYVIGDVPDVDIVGANLYKRYVKRSQQRQNAEINGEVMNGQMNGNTDTKDAELIDPELPQSRNAPVTAKLRKQTITDVYGILVCTGVYKPGMESCKDGDEKNYQGHRDFPRIPELYKPYKTCTDVEEALEYVMQREGIINL